MSFDKPPDPYGGDPIHDFPLLVPNSTDRYPSVLSGSAKWKTLESSQWTILSNNPDLSSAVCEVTLCYDDVDWNTLRNIYGWAATQYQAWIRGTLTVEENCLIQLHVANSPEFIIDQGRFEGDIYNQSTNIAPAPLIIPLAAGQHTLNIR